MDKLQKVKTDIGRAIMNLTDNEIANLTYAEIVELKNKVESVITKHIETLNREFEGEF